MTLRRLLPVALLAAAFLAAAPAWADPAAGAPDAAAAVAAAGPAPSAPVTVALPTSPPVVVAALDGGFEDPTAVAKLAVSAAQNGSWWLVLSALLILGIWALRRFGARFLPPKAVAFFAGDLGGAILAVLGSMAGALIAALTAGQPMSVALLGSAFKVAIPPALFVWTRHAAAAPAPIAVVEPSGPNPQA